MEVMPEKFLNYLPVTVICNLLFVSRLSRQVILKNFKNVFDFSTGFTSEKHWFSIIQKAAYDICEVVMNEKFFDPVFFNYHFNYEERLLGLVEKFKIHLSLFSVFMHFVRCIRSCEKVSTARTYCKVCSRVADFHLNPKTLFSKYSSDIIWFFIVRFKF